MSDLSGHQPQATTCYHSVSITTSSLNEEVEGNLICGLQIIMMLNSSMHWILTSYVVSCWIFWMNVPTSLNDDLYMWKSGPLIWKRPHYSDSSSKPLDPRVLSASLIKVFFLKPFDRSHHALSLIFVITPKEKRGGSINLQIWNRSESSNSWTIEEEHLFPLLWTKHRIRDHVTHPTAFAEGEQEKEKKKIQLSDPCWKPQEVALQAPSQDFGEPREHTT